MLVHQTAARALTKKAIIYALKRPLTYEIEVTSKANLNKNWCKNDSADNFSKYTKV